MNKYKDLLDNLKTEEIIDIVMSLGADRYKIEEDYIVFPTICHNENSENASMKLYYYFRNKKFHCYTSCGENFNLYGLINRVWKLQGYERNFSDILKFVLNKTSYIFTEDTFSINRYKSKKQLFNSRKTIQLPVQSEDILDIFEKIYPVEWLNENISKEAMDIYNIRYSISRNKIIIPHYNLYSQLVGIRGRALNENEVKEFGKYMPVEIEGKWFAHPLSLNLYGLNLSKDYIKKEKKVCVFEGEKSCLIYRDFFPDKNISVAVCGSSFCKTQLDLLMKNCPPEEIIICFDKEYDNYNSKEADDYFLKLYNMCKKYNKYTNFSFIFDRKNLLKKKDSPVDRGKEIFLELFKNRVIVR